jgi:hypothetical protein
MGTPAGQYIPPAQKTGASKPRAKPALKPLVDGKPNPNIGMGLKTSSDLPQFGEQGWVNPNWDPYHNADGYHRFDPKIPGMGLQYSKTYADGARTFDSYQNIAKGKPGYTHAQNALTFMTDNGINPARANDIQKFAAMDYSQRLVQWKNQRPKRKFTLKQAFGTVVQIGATIYGGPWGAAAGSAFNTALQGGDLSDIAKNAAISGGLAWAGGVIGDKFSTLGGPTTAGNSIDAMVAASTNAGSAASTLGRIAAGAGNTFKAVAPHLRTAGQVGGILANDIYQSGVNLTPTQFSNLRGGNREITTFEPENKNIALSSHPTSSYLKAYPGLANVSNTNSGARPINTTPIARINTPGRNTAPYAAPKPYVAPPRVQIAPNIPIINYDPSRNYPQTTTMQQALMRPAATRAPSQNARTA